MKKICTLLVKLYIICSRMQRVNLHARPSIIQVGCPTCCHQVCALDHANGGIADLDYHSGPCHRNVPRWRYMNVMGYHITGNSPVFSRSFRRASKKIWNLRVSEPLCWKPLVTDGLASPKPRNAENVSMTTELLTLIHTDNHYWVWDRNVFLHLTSWWDYMDFYLERT